MPEWWSKICRILNRRRGLDDDLDEEMRAHLDLMVEDNLGRGMPPEKARAAARRHFGNQTATRERAREAWQFPRIETVLQDLRHGLRFMRNSPSFSLVMILSLALGIGANTAIFSVVYSVLLRPFPYPAGERLVWLGESTQKAHGISVTWINFQHWRAENDAFENMAGFQTADLTMTGRGDALLTRSALVTNSFFHLIGARPLLGRLFTESDDRPGAAPTVVLTYEFWANVLGADPSALGATLALNGRPYQVIGVLNPGLWLFMGHVDYYLPLGQSAGNTVKRSDHGSMRVLGLLKPGVTLAGARADLDAVMQSLALADPGAEDDHRAFAQFLAEETTGRIRESLLLLMGAAGLILILACANVASLLLVRSTARERELAIRTAIGAGRSRLARQLLTENLAIAALGGSLGLVVAGWCLRTVALVGPRDIPRLSEATSDIPVLLFAAAATLVAGLLAGLAPVFTARGMDLTTTLKAGSSASGEARRGHAFRNTLVVAEIAITLILAFASGLLLRSLIAAQTAYPGFDSGRLLALELQLPGSRYKTGEQARQFYDRLVQDLRARPGIEAVGLTGCPPSSGGCGDWWYSILDRPAPARGDVPLTLLNIADPAYFEAMHIHLVAGRGFTDADRTGGPRVVVINEDLARRWWPASQMALGRQIKIGGPYMEGPVCEIVGVVGNVSQMGLDTAPLPEVFFAFAQNAKQAMTVMIRTRSDPAPWIPAVRREVASIDRNVPIKSLRFFEERLGASLGRRRFSTLLLGVFAALAMILAAVGIYGVLNYWVGVRQKEIAIRLAVGAQRSAILRWAGWHAMRLVAFGIGLGAFGGWGAARWLKNLVYGVGLRDPAIILAAGAMVVATAALAAGIPLWRATRVDAVRNLRDA